MSAPPVRTPRDLVELRSWLHAQWMPGATFARHAAPQLAARVVWDRGPNNAEGYRYWECQNLKQSTLWWVSEEMCDLLIAASKTIPEDVHYADLTPPSPSGLVVFAKPWLGIDADVDDHLCQVDAINWGGGLLPPLPGREPKALLPPLPGREPKAQPSLCVTSYRHIDFDEGMHKHELELAAALGGYEHMVEAERIPFEVVNDEEAERLKFEEELDEHGEAIAVSDRQQAVKVTSSSMKEKMTIRVIGHTWLPLGRSDWPIGDRLGDPPWLMSERATASYVEDRRVLVALFTLLRESGIARTEITHADRPTRRRAERSGFSDSNVQIVTLRRLSRTQGGDDSTGGKREWSHRWLVGGHFRWQPCGKGRAERRLTYIAPYVKGPEDKPFQTKERVNAWRR